MAQVPQTRKKLREAKFFLGRMSEAEESPRLDKDDFDFYLSAFLSAGRSVTLFLQVEQKELYDACFLGWSKAPVGDEPELLKFMNAQRVAEVHKGGAEVYPMVERVPVTEAKFRDRRHPAYGISWWGPPGVPPPTIGTKVHYFQIGDTREQAVETCKRYLQLLEKWVRDVEGRLSAE